MITHTYKTIQEKLERLGVDWSKCKLAWYSIFTDKPYWAVKVQVSPGYAVSDVLTFKLDHRSVEAVRTRINTTNGRIGHSYVGLD